MAKKESLTLDDFDLDNDLNFNFDIDDIDGQVNPDIKKSKRTPVGDVFKGTIAGAKTKITDPNFVSKTIRDSLPKQYGEVFDTTDKITSSLSSLYDETIREIKPELSRVAKKVDRLVPEESRFFKKLSSTFSKLLGNEFSDYKSPTKEQFQEQSITNSLASIFDAQNQVDAIEKARQSSADAVNRGVEQKRFTTNYQLLYGIDRGINRLVQYNDKITQAYQKKSLELQYRSFFIQSELLDTSKRYFEVFKNQNEGIAKNTSLPEYVKITDSERFKEATKSKFIKSMQKGLFGDNDIIGTAVERLKAKVKENIQGFKQGLEMGLMGLDEFESAKQQMDDMRSMGVEVDSKYSLGGNILGDTLMGKLGQKISGKIRKSIPKDSPLANAGYKALDYIRNPVAKIDKLRDTKFMRENRFGSGPKGLIANTGDFLLDLFKPDKTDLTVGSDKGLGNLDAMAPGFSNRAIKSITDVIPGYLSRIHREILMLRKGSDNEPLLAYDYSKDGFKVSTQLSSDLKELLKSKAERSSYKGSIDLAYRNLVGKRKFSDIESVQKDMEDRIKKVIRELSQDTLMDYTPENILNSEAVEKSGAAGQIKKALDQKMRAKGGKARSQAGITKAFTDVRRATPDLRAEIELMIKSGYGDLLESEGLLKRNEKGELEIDLDQYNTIISSDVNVKQGIKAINPRDALAAVKKTKIYDWFYKLGKGDNKPHTGPMAQDVKKNLGNKAAPDGTKIDLTTMNGVNMAAIQALDEKVSKQTKGGKSDSLLAQIKQDTSTIVELLSKRGVGINIGTGNLKELKELLEQRKGFYNAIVEPTVKYSFEAFNRVTTGLKQGLEFGKDKVASPFFKFLTESYSKNKDGIKEKVGKLFSTGLDLANNALSYTTNLLTNVIPTTAKDIYSYLKDKATKVYDLLEGPIDIYTQKTKIPLLRANLIKAGYYIDQTTGKVIKSVRDIKGPVVNRLGEVVLSIEDLAEGLVDKDGKSVLTPFEKMTKAAIGYAAKGFERVKNFYTNLANGVIPNKVKSWFKASETENLSSSKTYDILVEIRDLIKAKSNISGSGIEPETVEEESNPGVNTSKSNLTPKYKGSGFDISNLFNKAKGRFGKIGSRIGSGLSILGGMFSGSSPKQDQNTSVEAPEAHNEQEVDNDKPSVRNRVKHFIDSSKAKWNDKDASGRRDGDWRDRLDAMKDKAKVRFQKADLTARYRSPENVLDTIAKQAAGLFSFLKEGSSGLLSTIGDVVSTGAGSLGLGKLGGLIKKLPGGLWKGVKGSTGLIGKGINAVRSVGAPLVNTLSKVKNVATVGRILSAGNAVRTVMAVGSLATAGLGSTVMGGAYVAMTGLAAAVSSPVVLGAAAIAGTAYGAYKAYKYFTRDDINIYDLLRIKQYGLLNSERDKHHNHQIVQLEEYLQDGRIGYDRGKAYFLNKKIDIKEMLSIFNIDSEDNDSINRYTEWFEHRFKPFFLTNLTALYEVNNKSKLSEISKLTLEERSKFLDLASFESGPYDVQVSPFKDIERLNTDPKIIKDMIESIRKMHKEDISKKPKTPLDLASIKMKEAKDKMQKLRDNKYQKNKDEVDYRQSNIFKDSYDSAVDKTSRAIEWLVDKTNESKEYLKQAANKAISKGKETVDKTVKWTAGKVNQAAEWTDKNIMTPVKDSLAGIIQRAESGNKGYNAYNRGTADGKILGPVGDRNLTSMTLSDILEDSKRSKSDPQRLFAVGKYQMIPDTLRDGINQLKINPDETKYEPVVQERLFSDYLLDKKRPKISAFIKGKNDNAKTALDAAASEWASLPDPDTGVSKYGHGNKSSVTVPTLLSALEKSREAYKQYIASGMSEKEAYQKAVSSNGAQTPSETSNTAIASISQPTSDKDKVNNILKTSFMTSGYAGSVNAVASNDSNIVKASLDKDLTQAENDIGSSLLSKPTAPTVTTAAKPYMNTEGPLAKAPSDIDSFNYSNPKPLPTGDRGQGFDIGGVESAINHVGETLDKSLNVQQQMLSVLQDILKNATPGNMQQVQDGLKQVATQAKKTAALSEPAIDLSRKSA